ncbi:aminodeoxychorismate synthase component I [Marinivivus vitaminiproducens]|uniref:aminodeoxychorismate synthase component I n=1 Tax=Marinivivus vitaminiproducens TaxID=3035935 RepID=UPI0027A482D1|nr:aminodeoxychorismate synthase component I [Geminicoccaceae bacterium SCSIO 64248]
MYVRALPFRDPLAALSAFHDVHWLAFLDSAASDPRSHYSYIGLDPFRTIVADRDGVRIDGRSVQGDPFGTLRSELSAFRAAASDGPVPFTGGAIGYVAYEAGRHVDRFPPLRPDRLAVPDMAVGLYDLILAFDRQEGCAWLMSSGLPERDPTRQKDRARVRALAVLRQLEAGHTPSQDDGTITGAWQAERSRADVESAIARAIEYIRAGDIFQVNLTQRRIAAVPDGLDDLALYRRLRLLSPAPFAAFLRCGPGLAVMSASPERFLHLDTDGHVETRPIKGTRRRDADEAVDRALAGELAASEKDRAENLMIVDLMRNDLGRVCEVGSIDVPVLRGIETFASVHHMVSAVTGRLRPGLDAIDLLRACFPGGSITGAPKIRAMEIIAELEPHRRGVCFGSVLRLGFDGSLDSNIAIRTMVRVGDRLQAQAGGGIVADSDPSAEYDEALLKMRPLLHALTGERR